MPQLEPKTDDLCRSKYIDVLLLFKFRLVDEKDRTFWPIGLHSSPHNHIWDQNDPCSVCVTA